MSDSNQNEYQTLKIYNRSYLGGKHKLIPFIKRVIEPKCPVLASIADIFAGTGVVASSFPDKKVITNDLLYCNYISNVAWLSSEKYSIDTIVSYIRRYNSITTYEENYMTENFSNTYFSPEDCSKIGIIREDIEQSYKSNKINERERAILITSLMYAMDKIANTFGHYDGFRKSLHFDKHLELRVPLIEQLNQDNECYNKDANELVKEIQADLVYIDPPYNSRQYCDSYHLLENVARWEKPEVFGALRKMDRTGMKSQYCTKHAPRAFEDLIANINAKYILVSYNNMADKGDGRSNAKITDNDLLRVLSKKGDVDVFSQKYKAYTVRVIHNNDNTERLFLCTCK